MFLSNQPFQRSWESQSNKPIIKDWHYYKTQQHMNLWDNPNRVLSKKIAKFYHEPEQLFKESHKSDEEIILDQQREFEEARKFMIKEHISLQHQQYRSRKGERELLQFKANQAMTEDPSSPTQHLLITNMNSTIGTNYSMTTSKRAKQKDPSKSPTVKDGNNWEKLDSCPPKAIANAISPKMIELDRQACDSIIEQMNHEKELQRLQKEYLVQSRQSIRHKLHERKSQVEEIHKKAGQPIIKGVDSNQFETAMKVFRESQMVDVKLQSPRSKYESTSSQMNNTMSDGFQRTITMNFGNRGSVNSQRLKFLAQPKSEYEPPNLYEHKDFRGLLHADHQEAVKTILSQDQKLSTSSRYGTTIPTKRFPKEVHSSKLSQPTIQTTNDLPQIKLPTANDALDNTQRLDTMASAQYQQSTTFSPLNSEFSHNKAKSTANLGTQLQSPYATLTNPSFFNTPAHRLASGIQLGDRSIFKRRQNRNIFSGGDRSNTMTAHSNLAMFNPNEQEIVQKALKEMDVMDKRTINLVATAHRRGGNRYPGLELEKSMNLEKYFNDKAASKKQHHILLAQAKVNAHKH